MSTDGVESHKKFCDSLKLPFPLLADEGARVSTLYGITIKTPAGESLSGRSVFLIDKQGVVRHADARYDLKTPDDHAVLIKAVQALGDGKEKEKKTSSAPFRQPRIDALVFGRITVDGKQLEEDVIFEHGKVRERDKGPSRALKAQYGHTPLTVKEEIPWDCKRLLIGIGMDGQLPVLDEVKAEARKRGVELILMKTEEAVKYLEQNSGEDLNVILHITC